MVCEVRGLGVVRDTDGTSPRLFIAASGSTSCFMCRNHLSSCVRQWRSGPQTILWWLLVYSTESRSKSWTSAPRRTVEVVGSLDVYGPCTGVEGVPLYPSGRTEWLLRHTKFRLSFSPHPLPTTTLQMDPDLHRVLHHCVVFTGPLPLSPGVTGPGVSTLVESTPEAVVPSGPWTPTGLRFEPERES